MTFTCPHAARARWRPIAEIHEDYGEVVLINIGDPFAMSIGSNLCDWFDMADWTHFAELPLLTGEMAAEMGRG